MTIPDPACMSTDELAGWLAQSEYFRHARGGYKPSTEDPCGDCTVAFHLEMRAEGHCNGIPGLARKGRVLSSKAAIMARIYHFRRVLVDMGLDPAHAESVG